MKRLATLLATAAFSTSPLFAANDHGAHHPATAQPEASGVPLSEGEIRKVDKENGKVTINHGPIANLDMPPMTMVFRVKDPALLDRVKAGDAIRFKAEKLDGSYTLVELQPK